MEMSCRTTSNAFGFFRQANFLNTFSELNYKTILEVEVKKYDQFSLYSAFESVGYVTGC